jgi:hypothetical protein
MPVVVIPVNVEGLPDINEIVAVGAVLVVVIGDGFVEVGVSVGGALPFEFGDGKLGKFE